jgi:protein-tyrosine phosphatase
MVDIHCHILPAVDDGSRSWEITREMCRVAAEDGIRHVVATPHCNDEFSYDRERYERLKEKLLEASDGRLEFSIGCDFHFSYENITDAIENPKRYSINGTRYMLIEFSDYGIPPNVTELLFQFTSRGMVPIVTHPERNQILARRPEKVLELVNAGALVQVTANSITGFWGGKARSVAEWLLAQGAVHVIASDAHDSRRRRPVLSEARNAVARTLGEEAAKTLVSDNPRAIVEGKPLPSESV